MPYSGSSPLGLPTIQDNDVMQGVLEKQIMDNAAWHQIADFRYVWGGGVVKNDDGSYTKLGLSTTVPAGRWMVKGVFCESGAGIAIKGLQNGKPNYSFAQKGTTSPWDKSVAFVAKVSNVESVDQILIGSLTLDGGGVVTSGTNDAVHLSGNWPFKYTYATSPLRLAATGFVESDLGHAVLQKSDATWWTIAVTSPISWQGLIRQDGAISFTSPISGITPTNGAHLATKAYVDSTVSGSTHNLLSATHADTVTASVVAGDIIIGNSTPKWARLAVGATNQVMTVVSGLPAWANPAWVSASGVTSLFTSTDNVAVGTGIANGKFRILQATLGSNVLALESTPGSGDNPNRTVQQGKVTTTDATVTTINTVAITASRTYWIQATVIGRRTGGSAGTADDAASWVLRGTYKTVSGTVTLVGSTFKEANKDQAGWDANLTISGTNVLVQVTGATNNNVSFSSTAEISFVGT